MPPDDLSDDLSAHWQTLLARWAKPMQTALGNIKMLVQKHKCASPEFQYRMLEGWAWNLQYKPDAHVEAALAVLISSYPTRVQELRKTVEGCGRIRERLRVQQEQTLSRPWEFPPKDHTAAADLIDEVTRLNYQIVNHAVAVFRELQQAAQAAPASDKSQAASVKTAAAKDGPILGGRCPDKKRRFIDHLIDQRHVNDSDRQIEAAGICTRKTAARWRAELAQHLPAAAASAKGGRARTMSVEAAGADAVASQAARKF